ncbi:MAG TPA: energy transducer TonB [Kofleriaceae bacterium]
MVGSLVVNGALVALLLAIAPRVLERAPAARALLDVSLEPLPPPPPLPPKPVVEPPAPIATAHRTNAPRAAPPPPTEVEPAPASVGDLASDSGSGDGTGSASSDGSSGSGSGGSGGIGTGAPGVAATMPIPIGARAAQLPYTRDALLARTEGNVLVRVVVGADGKVSEATLASGLGHGLDAIALALATKLEFRPARDALGQPTTARITWRFHFVPPANAAAL